MGRITIERPEPDWEARMDEWGFPGLFNATYAYAEFVVPKTCRALATIPRVSAFRLNGTWFPGATYASGPSRVPVILEAGTNRILLKLAGYGPTIRGTFLLSPVPDPLWVDPADTVVPDLVRGRDLDAPIGVPVWNTTDRWIGPLRLEARIPGLGIVGMREIAGVAPLCVRKPALPIHIPWARLAQRSPAGGALPAGDAETIPLVITVRPPARDGAAPPTTSLAHPETLRVHLREPDQPRRVNFVSTMDHSAQFYAVLPPSPPAAPARRALVLTHHGAGVDALNQVRSYAPKSWAYVIAPTNRRPYGFDWQDWGRRDALEVLDIALESYPIDPDRVMLTGHSMGGHGAWVVGLQHPHRFAALAPSAGWSHFDLYVPMTLRRTSLFGSPELNALWHRMRLGDRVPRFLENVRHLPVLVLHGGADDNVPPTHGRFLASELDGLGGRVTYLEVPEKGHWWDDEDDRPGVACVDHPRIMTLFRSARRDPHPPAVEFRLADLTVDGGSRYWVEVLEQEVPLQESWIRARVTGRNRLDVETRNVAAVLLDPEPWAPSGKWDVRIDGRRLRASERPMVLVKSKGRSRGWRELRGGSRGRARLLGRPETLRHHGLKAGFLSPFILVFGTSGTHEETTATLNVARSLARLWTYRGNGDAPILSDRQAAAALEEGRLHLEGSDDWHLVMIGNESCNALLKHWSRKLDVNATRQEIRASGDWEWVGPGERGRDGREIAWAGDFSVAALVEDPMRHGRITALYGGTSARSIRRSLAAQPFFAGAGWPDLAVFDESLQGRGWGELRGAAIRRRLP
jgi:acetyl esterase/lipase